MSSKKPSKYIVGLFAFCYAKMNG